MEKKELLFFWWTFGDLRRLPRRFYLLEWLAGVIPMSRQLAQLVLTAEIGHFEIGRRKFRIVPCKKLLKT